jgi:hypothetical protein
MRKLGFVLVLAVLSISTAASAETWKAGLELVKEKSPAACAQPETAKVSWDLTFEGNTFSGVSNAGAHFSTTAEADGAVKTTYSGIVGVSKYFVELSGNAKTRQIELHNTQYGCFFRLVPTP